MKNSLQEHNITFNYEIIDMRSIDCKEFFESDNPEAVVVSILCDFKGQDERKFIRKILEKLLKITKNENEFRKCFAILEELSTNRDLQDVLEEEEMALQYLTWEDLPSYRVGEKKGMQRGIQKGLQKGIEKEREDNVLNMLKVGMSDDMILKIVNIDKEKLNQLKEKYANS
ncbi:MAG: hypothetical protein GXO40_02105 [Epsilonproteobacteria bacterium]|nr:hypothetical protein [Campylobacterota bacterium]